LLPASVAALGIALGLAAILAVQTGGNATKIGGNASKGETEWRFFGSDAGATRYSPANQINSSNVQNLSVAWRFSTRNLGPRPATGMQVSRYTTASATRDVVAIDAATAQLLWHWRPTGDNARRDPLMA
jgi:glucose dehydrogenase